ncbi:MAG: hypothetical protein VYA21_01450, partial [Verrucomicrobiota bacterium]|nr:hypothetical protein [Verrucomicrobiota bacterium]
MAAGNKCAAPPDLGAGSDDYKAALAENCDALVESQDCFAETAGRLNVALDMLSRAGAQTLSDGSTVDDLLGGVISEASSLKIGSVDNFGERKKGDTIDNDLSNDMIRWQAGTEEDDEGNIRPLNRAALLQTSGRREARAAKANSGRNRANRLFGRKRGQTSVEPNEKELEGPSPRIQDIATAEIIKLKERGAPESDIERVRQAVRTSISVGNVITAPGLTSCAEKYDEIEQELQTAATTGRTGRRGGIGTAAVSIGESGEERTAAAAALL